VNWAAGRNIAGDGDAGGDRRPASVFGRALQTEQRQKPVPQNLVGFSTRGDYPSTHRSQELADDERPCRRAGALARSAQVDKHDDDVAFRRAGGLKYNEQPEFVTHVGYMTEMQEKGLTILSGPFMEAQFQLLLSRSDYWRLVH
jgi:hypothetical protein